MSPLRLVPPVPPPLHPGLVEPAHPGRSVRIYLGRSAYVKAIPYDDGTIELAVVIDGVQVAVLGAGDWQS